MIHNKKAKISNKENNPKLSNVLSKVNSNRLIKANNPLKENNLRKNKAKNYGINKYAQS